MFWKVIEEPLEGRLFHSEEPITEKAQVLPGGGAGRMNLKETLLSRAKGVSAQ